MQLKDYVPPYLLESKIFNINYEVQQQEIDAYNENMDKIDAAVIAKLLEAKGYADDKIAQLVNAAPGTMDTLKELADALGDYPDFRTTILNMISAKANSTDLSSLQGTVNTHLADNVYQTSGGTATAITLTIKGTLTTGYPMTFIASASNNGAATTINTYPLYKPNTTTAPNLIAGKAYSIWYSATGNSGNPCFFIKASAEGTAVAANVLASTTFSNDDDTGIEGTMPNNGALNYTPSSSVQTIPAGYTTGGTVAKGYAIGSSIASTKLTSINPALVMWYVYQYYTYGGGKNIVYDSVNSVVYVPSCNGGYGLYALNPSNGSVLKSWWTSAQPSSVAVDRSGYPYAIAISGTTIAKVNPNASGSFVWSLSTLKNGPVYVAVQLASQNVYVAENNGVVEAVSSAGVSLGTIINLVSSTPVGNMVFDSNSNLYVQSGSSYSQILKYNSSGNLVTSTTLPGGVGGPASNICTDGQGNLYISYCAEIGSSNGYYYLSKVSQIGTSYTINS
jgi:hypothetical protein